jgi:hypothetical protein
MSLSVEQKTEIKSLAFGHRDEKLKLGVKLFYCSEAVAELWVTDCLVWRPRHKLIYILKTQSLSHATCLANLSSLGWSPPANLVPRFSESFSQPCCLSFSHKEPFP